MFDWQDLYYFTVLARTQSLSAAARELQVEHATVGRRIDALEKSLGLRLVDRLPRSRPLTEDGRALARLAGAMTEIATGVEQLSRIASIEVAGTVRVSAPPSLASHCIAPRMAALRERHPKLNVVLLPSLSLVALDRGEADIALRTEMCIRDRPGGIGGRHGLAAPGYRDHVRRGERPAVQRQGALAIGGARLRLGRRGGRGRGGQGCRQGQQQRSRQPARDRAQLSSEAPDGTRPGKGSGKRWRSALRCIHGLVPESAMSEGVFCTCLYKYSQPCFPDMAPDGACPGGAKVSPSWRCRHRDPCGDVPRPAVRRAAWPPVPGRGRPGGSRCGPACRPAPCPRGR